MSAYTIRAADLSLVLAAHKMRRANNGRTCRLCVMTESPMIPVSCRDKWRSREDAAKWGIRRAHISPIQRGDIGRVYERVKLEHGRREVQKTWGIGIRALRTEPRYTLDGGSAAA